MTIEDESAAFLGSPVLNRQQTQEALQIPRKPVNYGHQSVISIANLPPPRASHQRFENVSYSEIVSLRPQIVASEQPESHGFEARIQTADRTEDYFLHEEQRPLNQSEDESSDSEEADEPPAEPTPITDINDTTLQKSRLSWRPRSLRYVGSLLIFLLLHIMVYAIGAFATNSVFVNVSRANGWFFQFAPSVLAVFIKEWCGRVATDYRSIAPFLPRNLIDQSIFLKYIPFERPKLWNLNPFRSAILHSRFDVLSRFASILILVHSFILSTQETVSYESAVVSTITPDIFTTQFIDSKLPALIVPSYFTNQRSSAAWFQHLSFGYGLPLGLLVGALPFHYESPTYFDIITANTSGFSTELLCTQIKDPIVRMRSAGNNTWDVSVNLLDDQGCGFNDTYLNVPLTGPGVKQGIFPTGAVGNNTFALWQYIDSAQYAYVTNQSCNNQVQSFLISGQVDGSSLPQSSDDFITIETSDTLGWAALSCFAAYYLFNETITITTFPENGTTTITKSPTPNDTIFLKDTTSFDVAMQANFLDTGLVWNLSSIMTGETFWNAPAKDVWPWSGGADFVHSLCREGSDPNFLDQFPNVNACKMFMNAHYIWETAFALSVPLTAAYWPAELRTYSSAIAGKFQSGWYVSRFALTLSGFLHFLMIILLCISHMIEWPIPVPRWFKSVRTGLKRNPSSIAAKAEIFQKPRIRSLFTGLDALSENDAEGRIRERVISAKTFAMYNNGPNLGPVSDKTRIDSPYINLTAEEGEQPQEIKYDNIRRLTEDETELSKLRFAFASWAVHWASLLLMLLLTCCILAAGIYTAVSERSYWFWPASWWLNDDSWVTFDKLLAQQVLFSILPVLILLLLRWWWTSIDTFFRHSQPYVGLYHSLSGARSLCLTYINDVDIAITLKAYRNKDYRLAFITINTLLVKIALALAGGLFTYQAAVSSHAVSFQALQTFRNGTFLASSASFDIVLLRSVIVHSISGGSYYGWQTDLYAIPAVDVGHVHGQYQMRVSALSATLDCEEVQVEFSKQFDNASLTAHAQGTSCGDIEWSEFCYFEPGADCGGMTGSYILNPFVNESTTVNVTASATLSSSTASSTISSSSTTMSTGSSSVTASSGSLSSTQAQSTIAPPAPTRSGTTSVCYEWYTPQPGEYCWEIAQRFGMDWEYLRTLNPDIDAGCGNLQPDTSYCIAGVPPSRVVRRDSGGGSPCRDWSEPTNFAVESDPGSCTGWHYINSSTCRQSSGSDGVWWIIDAHGTPYWSEADVYGLHNVSNSTSLVCAPKYHRHVLDISVNVFVNQTNYYGITVDKVVSTENISANAWTAEQDGSSITFSDYFSANLEYSQFAGAFTTMTKTKSMFLDTMSLVSASISANSTSAFQNITEFQRVASSAFSRTFAHVVNTTVLPDGSTFLMRAITADEGTPAVLGYEYIFSGRVLPVPLYATLVVIALYIIAIFFVYPDRSRRMALDPSIPTNAATSIYDSSIMNIIRDSLSHGRDPFEDLKDMRFAYGVYRGVSKSDRRLGIDVADRVDPIWTPKEKSRLFLKLIRGRRDHDFEAEERLSVATGRDAPIPCMLEGSNHYGWGGRQDYDIDAQRYNSGTFVQRRHGLPTEISYSLVKEDSPPISDKSSTRSRKKVRFSGSETTIGARRPIVKVRAVSRESYSSLPPRPRRRPGWLEYVKGWLR